MAEVNQETGASHDSSSFTQRVSSLPRTSLLLALPPLLGIIGRMLSQAVLPCSLPQILAFVVILINAHGVVWQYLQQTPWALIVAVIFAVLGLLANLTTSCPTD